MTGVVHRSFRRIAVPILSVSLAVVTAGSAGPAEGAAPDPGPVATATCEAAPRRVELDATGRAPGSSGWMDLRFGDAPHGVAVTEDGSYRYEISVRITSVPGKWSDSALVAWAATPNLDRHVRLGAFGEEGAVEGEVSWNKFLVFVTAESSADVETWQGPVLMKAISPSGNMHTMAGHGIYQQHGIGC